jgi:hypothetical protein
VISEAIVDIFHLLNSVSSQKVVGSLVGMFTSPRPYKVERWNDFLGDVRQEGAAFKEVLRAVADQKERANTTFARASQKSFNAIHNVARRKMDESRAVPRLSRQGTRGLVSRDAPKINLAFDVRISNHDRWPRRSSSTRSSQRIFSPTRLNDYRALGGPPAKDMICLYGSPVHNFSETG